MVHSSPVTTFSLFLPLLVSAVTSLGSPTEATSQSRINVLPLPSQYTTGSGSTPVCLASDFYIAVRPQANAPEDLKEAMKRTEKSLRKLKHEYLSVTRGSEFFKSRSNATFTGQPNCEHELHELVIHIQSGENHIPSILDNAILPAEQRPAVEMYNLSIPTSGPATISSTTALGAFRGLTTFENLFFRLPSGFKHSAREPLSKSDSLPRSLQLPLAADFTDQQTPTLGHSTVEDGRVYAPFAPYEIEDKPAFGWRAVLLDTSRHYFAPASIFKMLDTMAMVKLNVLHWHITDSNSWPLELSTHPELSASGAYSPSQIYSESTIRDIVTYAGERGIDVLIEVDTPGHTAIIAESRPELVACYQKPGWEEYAGQPPPGQLRFADPEVTAWTSGLFESIFRVVKSVYFGTGGDELNEKCMLEDEPTARALKANGWTVSDALNEFTRSTHATIFNNGKTPVVWQEMVLDHGAMPGLHKDTIIDIWINSADARKVLDKGYRIIHASSDYFYLDGGQGQWLGEEGGGPGGSPTFKSWARMYSFDPYKDVLPSQHEQILGGQASLWSEQSDNTNFEQLVWPRAAAVAELFWTGAGPSGYPRSSLEALPRMHDVRYRMVDRGVAAVPIQPHWCALRPGRCVVGA